MKRTVAFIKLLKAAREVLPQSCAISYLMETDPDYKNQSPKIKDYADKIIDFFIKLAAYENYSGKRLTL